MNGSSSESIVAWPAFSNRELNPYNSIFYEHLRELGVHVEDYRPNRIFPKWGASFHIHWPEGLVTERPLARSLLACLRLLCVFAYVSAGGGKVIWTVHNSSRHGKGNILADVCLYHILRVFCDIQIFLSADSRNQFITDRGWQSRWVCVCPHGHYRSAYGEPQSQELSRRQYSIANGDVVFLVMGRVMRYKGIEDVLDAFCSTSNPNYRLIIAGAVIDISYYEMLKERWKDSRVRWLDGHINNREVANLVSITDYCLLAYRAITNSGMVYLAMTYGAHPIAVRSKIFDEINKIAGKPIVTIVDRMSVWALSGLTNIHDRSERVAASMKMFGWETGAAIFHSTLKQASNPGVTV